MTEPLPADAADGEQLQFDNAEYTTPAARSLSCSTCKREIADTYYEVNGQVICPPCREAIANHLTGGSKGKRFFRAALFGTAAAIVGFAIYFGVIKLSGGRGVGLISILVGFMVGSAVRSGSQHRGGWFYQMLAIFLTYSAIGASYAAFAIPLWIAEQEKKNEPVERAATKQAEKPPVIGKVAKPHVQNAGLKNAGEVIVALAAFWAIVLGLLYALPILSNLQSPIGLFIIGFALWEAWKLNRRPKIVFNGPFHLVQAEVAPEPELPTDG